MATVHVTCRFCRQPIPTDDLFGQAIGECTPCEDRERLAFGVALVGEYDPVAWLSGATRPVSLRMAVRMLWPSRDSDALHA